MSDRAANIHPAYGGTPPVWLVKHWETLDRWRQERVEREAVEAAARAVLADNGFLGAIVTFPNLPKI